MLNPGMTVRLKADPSKIGIVTNTPPRELHGCMRYEVSWQNGDRRFHMESTLSVIEEKQETVEDIIEKGNYGRSSELRAALTFHRLSGTLDNLIYSLNVTNTEFHPYQFKPLLAFLNSPDSSLLIADEVGLGKTIEAGIIWTELRMRRNARRLLVICPAVLREKWKAELRDKFNVASDFVSADELADTVEKIREGKCRQCALIGSFQGLRTLAAKEPGSSLLARERLHKMLENGEGLTGDEFDLIIVDEAHNARNRDTASYRLLADLRHLTPSVLLLSATPVQTKPEDLFTLVNYVSPDMFPYEDSFKYALSSALPAVRLSADVAAGRVTYADYRARLDKLLPGNAVIERLQGKPLTREQFADHRRRQYLAQDLWHTSPLNSVLTRSLKRDVEVNRVIRRPSCAAVEMTEAERGFYDAVRRSVLSNFSRTEHPTQPQQLMNITVQRQVASSMQATYLLWRDKPEYREKDTEYLQEVFSEETAPLELDLSLRQVLAQTARNFTDAEALLAHDSKFERLLKEIEYYRSENPDKPVLLFSYFKKTLSYLKNRFDERGIAAAIYDGDVAIAQREALVERFRKGDIKILLCSEAASEGIDLQFVSFLVNYDLPWNPARIEQRIGRIDRFGQKEPAVFIKNFIYDETVEIKIYNRLIDRLDVQKGALGLTEEVLGELIDKMQRDVYSHELTDEEVNQRIDQTAMALEQKKHFEEEARGNTVTFDLFSQQAREAMELERFVTDRDLYNLVNEFLAREGSNSKLIPVDAEKSVYTLRLSQKLSDEFGDFLGKEAVEGRTNIVNNRETDVQFINKEGGRHLPKVERITQFHPLVKFIKGWIESHRAQAYKATAMKLMRQDLPESLRHLPSGDYCFDVQCFSYRGSSRRKKSLLVYRVVSAQTKAFLPDNAAEQLVSAASCYGRDWANAAQQTDASEMLDLHFQCDDALIDDEALFSGRRQTEDSDKAVFQISQYEKELNRKEQSWTEQASRIRNRTDSLAKASAVRLETEKRRIREAISGKIAEIRYRLNNSRTSAEHVNCGVIRVE